MSPRTLDLTSPDLQVSIDPGRGADVLSLVHRRTGVDALFRTPWRERADAVRDGQRPSTYDPVAGWLEQYRGGWQTLCPNAGDPRSVHGAPVAFHGEASVVPWRVDEASTGSARLQVELFSIPVRIDRVIELQGPRLHLADTLTNLSDIDLEFDYSSHPALGGPFLDGDCRLDTGARRFTSDPERETAIDSGSEHRWPEAITTSGERVDLRRIPPRGSSREVFGWLHDFTEHWVSVTNLDLGLTVRLDWDGTHLPYAWLWQELNATQQFPWYGRARAMAMEPASMQTSGPDRRSALHLGPRAAIEIPLSINFDDRSA
ncbi:DUF4432 family protein [Nocardia sp. NEAU-G5]|uniref:DUF4432 family protein n=1 Tax=Nocardia albiluteola TaxID=2842303 RepID=A0ABS6BE36_9NOCA|nr:DUF4432 family protein [Nocardia albiluteola]MBU3068056.1 DUF4432 family protein [Nocardia albiluteola]